jgi:3-oxoacyl-[acyl-carrier-protein] synthase II
LKRSARFTVLSLAATQLALDDAGLDLDRLDPSRTLVAVGNCVGGFSVIDEEMMRMRSSMDPANPWGADFDPLAAVKVMGNASAAQISIHYGLTGPSLTVNTACSSGATALCMAVDHLRLGRADVAIAGGSEAIVTPFGLLSFTKLATLSKREDEPARASRPFDRERDGFVLAEGAGMLLVETLDHARRRGAEIYAHVLGSGLASEAYNLSAPAPNGAGMAHAMTLALRDARVSPDRVDWVNAHGTSTRLNDQRESEAIASVFGHHARRLWVSSQKSMIGHTIGAAGAIEAGVTALAIRNGVVPPTINYEVPDPACPLDYVPNTARERTIDVAISNSFALGGHSAVVVLGREAVG